MRVKETVHFLGVFVFGGGETHRYEDYLSPQQNIDGFKQPYRSTEITVQQLSSYV